MSDTALLIMDVQRSIVERYSDDAGPLLDTLARAAAAAREVGVPVVYVRVAFRDGAPEISARNRAFGAIKQSGGIRENDPATEVHPTVAPQAGDVVVTKKRVSAFTGSDLDVVLRSLGTTHLVLTGISTSGVVLSTLRQAADLDYEITVLADGCSDADREVHDILLARLFPRQATVCSADEWITTLAAGSDGRADEGVKK